MLAGISAGINSRFGVYVGAGVFQIGNLLVPVALYYPTANYIPEKVIERSVECRQRLEYSFSAPETAGRQQILQHSENIVECTTMDVQSKNTLIRRDISGTYCLGFRNSHGLEVEEIRTIFSAFGEVLNIKETGDIRGYRFVRYQYADEAENAIEGLKTHPQIRLVEHKPKSNNKPDNWKNENKTQNINEHGTEFNNRNYDQRYKKHEENSNENLEENHNGNRNFKEQNEGRNENFEQEHHDSKEMIKDIKQNNSEINILKENDNETVCEINQVQSPCHSAKSCSSLTLLTSSLSDKSLFVEDDSVDLDIPDLVKSKNLKNTNVLKKTVLNAEEIIVGNIPNDLSPAFILHLFQHYDPIAITDVHFVKNIRYCHVYFKSAQDSLDVEKTFDRMTVSGQKLLVLRPCQLMQEKVHGGENKKFDFFLFIFCLEQKHLFFYETHFYHTVIGVENHGSHTMIHTAVNLLKNNVIF